MIQLLILFVDVRWAVVIAVNPGAANFHFGGYLVLRPCKVNLPTARLVKAVLGRPFQQPGAFDLLRQVVFEIDHPPDAAFLLALTWRRTGQVRLPVHFIGQCPQATRPAGTGDIATASRSVPRRWGC